MRLSLEDVAVQFGRRDVLKGLTWSVPDQGRTLLLGRNGAGKTTTLRVASGALRPSRGRVSLDSTTATRARLRGQVALMPQRISCVPGLSVVDQVAFAAWLVGLSESAARRAAHAALRQVDLEHMRGGDPSKLSGGELRRLGLAEAMAKPSEILLLDEPTAGLDPTQRSRFRDLLLAVDRPTVVSTHQLDDVDGLFNSVAVLEAGRIVFSGSIDEYLARGRGRDTARIAESAFVALTGQS